MNAQQESIVVAAHCASLLVDDLRQAAQKVTGSMKAVVKGTNNTAVAADLLRLRDDALRILSKVQDIQEAVGIPVEVRR